MTNPSRQSDPDVHCFDELRRIYTSALLACTMLALSVVFDGPVSILGWLLLISGFLCLAYTVIATRKLLTYFRSLGHKTDPRE